MRWHVEDADELVVEFVDVAVRVVCLAAEEAAAVAVVAAAEVDVLVVGIGGGAEDNADLVSLVSFSRLPLFAALESYFGFDFDFAFAFSFLL